MKMPIAEAMMPMPAMMSGKTTPRAGGEVERLEGRVAEDERGDDHDLVGLEQVGRHAGAVADVVADVVGDRGGVAGVVLGDAGLDLADEVGADVGGLGEDAAADTHEQRDQRAAEAEADEHGGGGVLEDEARSPVAPMRPRPTQNRPVMPPVRNATLQCRREVARRGLRPPCGRCRAPTGSCR